MLQSVECFHSTFSILLDFLCGPWRVRELLIMCPIACRGSPALATHDREHPVTLIVIPMNIVRVEVLLDHRLELSARLRMIAEERGAKRTGRSIDPVFA